MKTIKYLALNKVRTVAIGLVIFLGLGIQTLQSAKKDWEVRVEVRNNQSVARNQALLSGGIPFAQGRLDADTRLEAVDTRGQVHPVQQHSLGLRWPDNSSRWALIQFPVTIAANATETFVLRPAAGESVQAVSPVSVRETEQTLWLDNDILRFQIHKQGASNGYLSGMPDSVQIRRNGEWQDVLKGLPSIRLIADREHMTAEEFAATELHPNTLWSFGLGGKWNHAEQVWKNPQFKGKIYNRYIREGSPAFWTDWQDWSPQIERGIDYSKFFSGPIEWKVEEQGPLRAVIHFRGAREPSEGEIGFNGRISLQAGSSTIGFELTIENYEEFIPAQPVDNAMLYITNSKHIREFSLSFQTTIDPHRVEFGLDGKSVSSKIDGNTKSFYIQQQAQQQAKLIGVQEQPVTGQYANGWVSLSNEKHRVTLAHQYFAEIFPKRLGVETDQGIIKMDFWPAESAAPGYPLPPGRVRTYEFILGFDTDPREVAAAIQYPLHPYAGADYYTSTDVTYPLIDWEDPAFPAFKPYMQASVKRFVETQMLYGDPHYADLKGWSNFSAANDYHGIGNEMFIYYLTSGDPELFRLAEAIVKHNSEVDRGHWGSTAGAHHKQHTRDQIHMSARHMGGIAVWNFGDVDYYFLTGKRRMLSTLEQTIDFLLHSPGLNSSATPPQYYPDRATALPFKHLSYMFEAVGDESALTALYPKAYPQPVKPGRTDSMGATKSLQALQTLQSVSRYLGTLYKEKKPRNVPFMISYAPEGLYRFFKLTGDPQAREAVLTSARYLYTNESVIWPTGIHRYSGDNATHLREHPEQFWSLWIDEVDLPAARAYQLSHDPLFLEYMMAPLDWRLKLAGITINYNGFNSTVPSSLRVLKDAGWTEKELSGLRSDLDYEAAIEELGEAVKTLPPKQASMVLREGVRVLLNKGENEKARQWLEQIQVPGSQGEDEALRLRLQQAK